MDQQLINPHDVQMKLWFAIVWTLFMLIYKLFMVALPTYVFLISIDKVVRGWGSKKKYDQPLLHEGVKNERRPDEAIAGQAEVSDA